MSKRILFLFSLLFLTGCVTTGWRSDLGASFIHYETHPGDLLVDKGSSVRGKSCAYNILGFLSLGDYGIQKAKREGGLTVVSFYDQEIFRFGSLYGSICTEVYGK